MLEYIGDFCGVFVERVLVCSTPCVAMGNTKTGVASFSGSHYEQNGELIDSLMRPKTLLGVNSSPVFFV